MKKTLNMWTNTAASMTLADHECTERISQPNCTSLVMCRTES